MKRCPICRAVYPDDANFCPMDAGRLEDIGGGRVPSLDLPTMVSRLIGGRFRLGPQIGGGRTGEVYSAEDTQTGQTVALKLIAPAVFPTPLVAQRTERELKQLMKAQSLRSVRIFDVGRIQGAGGDRSYVAMELVTGPTLAQLVATQGPLPLPLALRLAIAIGEALAEAAKLGVIHRDVAPKNVIVVEAAQIKLINFGIPTPVTDKVLGLPEFLSPEQAEGKPVDQRSNIYSLGALLYFMLTGAPPFTGEIDAVLRQQTQTPPVPPSRRAAVPLDLERVILKALEKPSSRRHLTLRQLLGELDAIRPPAASAPAVAPAVVAPPAFAPPPPAVVSPPTALSSAKTMVGMVIPQALRTSASGAAKPQAVIVPDPKPQAAIVAEPLPYAPMPPVPAPAPLAPTAVAQQPPPRGKAAPATPSTKSGRRASGFRETMWFKKGEIDEAAEDGAPPSGEQADQERYRDDGTITAADRERLSLRSGGTQALQAEKIRQVVPGERMAPEDIVSELSGGRTRFYLILVSALAVAVVLIVYFAVLRR
jgi:hypothetical protein